jgi:hypothetical protein
MARRSAIRLALRQPLNQQNVAGARDAWSRCGPAGIDPLLTGEIIIYLPKRGLLDKKVVAS